MKQLIMGMSYVLIVTGLLFIGYGFVTDAGAGHYISGSINTDRLQWVVIGLVAALMFFKSNK